MLSPAGQATTLGAALTTSTGDLQRRLAHSWGVNRNKCIVFATLQANVEACAQVKGKRGFWQARRTSVLDLQIAAKRACQNLETELHRHLVCLLLQSAAVAGGAAVVTALGYYATLDVQKKFELASATGPLLRSLDAENSHRLGILAAKWGLFPRETRPDPDCLRVQLWGRTFPNPIGEQQQQLQQGQLQQHHSIWLLDCSSTHVNTVVVSSNACC